MTGRNARIVTVIRAFQSLDIGAICVSYPKIGISDRRRTQKDPKFKRERCERWGTRTTKGRSLHKCTCYFGLLLDFLSFPTPSPVFFSPTHKRPAKSELAANVERGLLALTKALCEASNKKKQEIITPPFSAFPFFFPSFFRKNVSSFGKASWRASRFWYRFTAAGFGGFLGRTLSQRLRRRTRFLESFDDGFILNGNRSAPLHTDTRRESK